MSEPTTPLRAHHRFLQEVISSSFGSDGISALPEELDQVSQVFQRAGGSWIRVYGGSVRDVTLLKKIVKVAVKNGHITKSPKWGA